MMQVRRPKKSIKSLHRRRNEGRAASLQVSSVNSYYCCQSFQGLKSCQTHFTVGVGQKLQIRYEFSMDIHFVGNACLAHKSSEKRAKSYKNKASSSTMMILSKLHKLVLLLGLVLTLSDSSAARAAAHSQYHHHPLEVGQTRTESLVLRHRHLRRRAHRRASDERHAISRDSSHSGHRSLLMKKQGQGIFDGASTDSDSADDLRDTTPSVYDHPASHIRL